MSDSEIFNQKRMNRCLRIQRCIMDNWQKTNAFAYTVRATDSVHGIPLGELRARYFAVGVGDDIVEVPFIDMLVVFSMIEQEFANLKKRADKTATDFAIEYEVTTDFSDEEAVRLLSGIQIDTPFDAGKRLRISAVPQTPDESADDERV